MVACLQDGHHIKCEGNLQHHSFRQLYPNRKTQVSEQYLPYHFLGGVGLKRPHCAPAEGMTAALPHRFAASPSEMN